MWPTSRIPSPTAMMSSAQVARSAPLAAFLSSMALLASWSFLRVALVQAAMHKQACHRTCSQTQGGPILGSIIACPVERLLMHMFLDTFNTAIADHTSRAQAPLARL